MKKLDKTIDFKRIQKTASSNTTEYLSEDMQGYDVSLEKYKK